MTPDGRIAVVDALADGRWRARAIAERITLFVEHHEVVVRLHDGEELPARLAELTGAEWRNERLTLHARDESLQLHGAPQLDLAWITLTSRACPVPELTRGLRSMGGRHIGAETEALHTRYFAPLLRARQRLQDAEPLDWRVSSIDVRALETHVRTLFESAAAERHPTRPPHRRALEAELLEAADPVFHAIARLAEAGAALHAAPEPARFTAWRAWASALRRLFVDADRSWRAVRAALENDRLD